jgi:hypothetical protein
MKASKSVMGLGYGISPYLATFDNWMKFEYEWRGILRRCEVPLDEKEGHDQPFMHVIDSSLVRGSLKTIGATTSGTLS